MSRTREAELALLIAEQEADDTSAVRTYTRSFDEELGDEPGGATLHDFIGRDFFGDAIGAREREVRDDRPTIRDLFYWKYLHNKHGWTYGRIAEHVGRTPRSIRHYVSRPYRKETGPMAFLEARVEVIRCAYEGGAYMREIAQDLFEEAGYSTLESCYVGLWDLFNAHGIKRRPGRLLHGMRSRDADPAAVREWRNANNAAKRAQGLLADGRPRRRCSARTRFGHSCRRLAINDSDKCVVHAMPHPTRKWTRENVVEALRCWTREHGRAPRAAEWSSRGQNYPNFRTVYALFGSWPAALAQAGVSSAPKWTGRGAGGQYTPRPTPPEPVA